MMQKNQRNTVAKSMLLKVLKEEKMALSHSELYFKMSETCDRVTVYRILKRLLDQEEIHKVSTADGEIKYALCHQCDKKNHTHDHAHFSCKKCGKTTCMYNVNLNFTLPKKYVLETVNVDITGVCNTCCDS